MRNFTFACLLLASLSSRGQSVVQKWLLRFASPGTIQDFSRAVITDGSGNAYIAYSLVSAAGNSDIKIGKYNGAGTQLWTATYDGPAMRNDMPADIKLDAAGNVYMTGRTQTANNYDDIVTLKLNSLGVLQWAATWNGATSNNDYGYSLALDASGNVCVGGINAVTDFSPDFVTLKYTNAGRLLWAQTYNGSAGGGDFGYSVGVDQAGNIYTAGSSEGFTRSRVIPRGIYTGMDLTAVKYSPDGVLQWAARYNGPVNGTDEERDMLVDAAGNLYMTGFSDGGTSTGTDMVTVMLNTNGARVWANRFNGPNSGIDQGWSLTRDPSGNVIVAGSAYYGTSNYNGVVIKYSMSGIQQWVANYDGGSALGESFYAVKTDGYGAIYATGDSRSAATYYDAATVKYTTNGAQVWAAKFVGPLTNGADGGAHIAVYTPISPVITQTPSVYVAGASTGIFTNTDAILIKYEQPIEILPVFSASASVLAASPARFSSGVYPNPFQQTTTINYTIPTDANVSINVYDELGREVRNLVNGFRKAGMYSVPFSAGQLSQGVYHYRVIARSANREFVETKKMVIGK